MLSIIEQENTCWWYTRSRDKTIQSCRTTRVRRWTRNSVDYSLQTLTKGERERSENEIWKLNHC